MKALVKSKAKPGLWLEEVPKPSIGINDVLIRVHRTGICGTDLQYYKWTTGRPARSLCRWPSGMSLSAKSSRPARMWPTSIPAKSSAGRAMWSAVAVAIAWPTAASVRRHEGSGRQSSGGLCGISLAPYDKCLGARAGDRQDVAAIFDPFGNAVHTALSFPVLGEDVLVTGAGPIGIMGAAVARHAERATWSLPT